MTVVSKLQVTLGKKVRHMCMHVGFFQLFIALSVNTSIAPSSQYRLTRAFLGALLRYEIISLQDGGIGPSMMNLNFESLCLLPSFHWDKHEIKGFLFVK